MGIMKLNLLDLAKKNPDRLLTVAIITVIACFMFSLGASNLSILLAVLLWTLAYRAFRSRIRGMRFSEYQEGGCQVVETMVGKLVFHRQQRQLLLKTAETERMLPYDDIHKLVFTDKEKRALLQEFIFEDAGVTDLLWEKYRDVVKVCLAVLVTRDKQAIPIYVVSQYQIRDLLNLDRYLLAVLRAVNLHCEIGLFFRKKAQRIIKVFHDQGLEQIKIEVEIFEQPGSTS